MTTTIQQRTIYKNQDQYFLVLKKTPKTIATIEVEVWGMSERPSLRRINAKVYKTTDGVNGAFNISKRAKTDLNENVEFAYLNLSPFGFGKKKVLLSADYILEGWEDTINNNIETLERNFKNDKWIIAEEEAQPEYKRMTFEEWCETDEFKAMDIEEIKHIEICQALGTLAKQKKDKGEEHKLWFKVEMIKEGRRHDNAKDKIYNKLPNGDIVKECEEELKQETEIHSKILEATYILYKQRQEQGVESQDWLSVEIDKEGRRHENAKEDIYYKLP